jgi:ribosome biogenesis GTPase / thiamine phosphate phosphatase
VTRKKNKLRVQFRKNAQRKTRGGDLTRELLDEDPAADHLAKDERLSGKGDLTRRRTIISAEQHGDQVLRQVDESTCLRGRVTSAVGLSYHVQADDGRPFACTVRRILRKLSTDERNTVVTGDEVLFLPTGADEGVIERVEPRHGVLARGSGGKAHVLVANVDQVLIVATAADPQLKPVLIDRFLISAEKGGVHAILCINKTDLVDPAALQPLVGVYTRLGYDVVLTSAARQQGVERLRTLLRGRETVFTGQSGVGKSSLLNAIQPGLALSTGEVSDWTRKGRHTTRRAQLHQLASGGWVVDTPGIRQLELWDVIREEIEGFYVEFRPFVTRCKFQDCLHTREAGCGVKWAVQHDLISPLRYENYLRIVTGDDAALKA